MCWDPAVHPRRSVAHPAEPCCGLLISGTCCPPAANVLTPAATPPAPWCLQRAAALHTSPRPPPPPAPEPAPATSTRRRRKPGCAKTACPSNACSAGLSSRAGCLAAQPYPIHRTVPAQLQCLISCARGWRYGLSCFFLVSFLILALLCCVATPLGVRHARTPSLVAACFCALTLLPACCKLHHQRARRSELASSWQVVARNLPASTQPACEAEGAAGACRLGAALHQQSGAAGLNEGSGYSVGCVVSQSASECGRDEWEEGGMQVKGKGKCQQAGANAGVPG